MNILFLDQFATPGGGQRSLFELMPHVRTRGWNARVALPGEGIFSGMLRAAGFPVDFIPCRAYTPARKTALDIVHFGGDLRRTCQAISALVAAHRTDLLYVNGPRLLPAAAWIARRHSIPLIYHCHHRLQQAVAIRLAAEALRWAHASVIACCRFAGSPLQSFVPESRSHVIYNGVPSPSWRRRPRDPVQAWNIGVVGRVEPEKGQLEFIEAARILSSESGNCRFLVAGAPLFSGPEYMEKVRAAARGLPVQFLGWQENVGSIFGQLDLLVVPSADIDSTPRVIVEALSGGIPVVAFPSGGIPEIIEDRNTGFLTKTRSAASLAAAIRTVLTMGWRPLREVAQRGRAAWERKYTLERFQEAVGDVIAAASSCPTLLNRSAATTAISAETRKTAP
jgi:glycosyltransferase involved in cell wall biosynthesis